MRFTLFFCCLASLVYSQNQENIWYFGRNTGINFNVSPPTRLFDSQINTWGGSATISDVDGNLLFYTDGETIYRRDHNVMDNGDNLHDSAATRSTTQAALIVPRPNNRNLYYIFSLGWRANSLNLATVDMSLDSGFGRITNKGRILEATAGERLAGVYHANKRDIWVITHGYQNDSFNVYLVSPTGVAAPIRQKVGSVQSNTVESQIGYLKVSHDGRKLAMVVYGEKYIEIFDFDNTTGQISNPLRINTLDNYRPYGLEFSPNNRFLYTTTNIGSFLTRSRIIQYNLEALDIAASRIVVKQSSTTSLPFYGALQLASNQKIYYIDGPAGLFGSNGRVNVIDNPNAIGSNVRVIFNGVKYVHSSSGYGLPNFVRGLTSTVKMSDICANSPIQFELTGALSVNSAVWTFGDGSPPANALTPQHTYTKKGLYTLQVDIAYSNGRNKILIQEIEIDSAASVLAPLPNICLTDTNLILTQGSPAGGAYSGKGVTTATGTFNPIIAGPGSVPITYSIGGCSTPATANILVRTPVTFTVLPPRDTICIDSGNINLDFISPAGGTYSGPGVTGNIFSPTTAGAGTHTINYVLADACRSATSFKLTVLAFTRDNDTTICIGEKAPLQVGGGVSYVWSPASGLSATNVPNPIAVPTTTTSYNVQMTNAAGCIGFDTVTVTVLPKIILDLKLEATNTCDSIQNISINDRTAAVPPLNFEYTWTKADGGQVKTGDFKTINFDRTGTLNIRLKPTSHCIDDTSINLKVELSKNYLAFNSTNVIQAKTVGCDANEPIQLEANGGKSYTWTPAAGLSNPKIANPIAAVSTSTTYTVKIVNAAGCMVERSVSIRVPQIPNFNLKIEKRRENCNTAPKVEFSNQSVGVESYNWEFGDGGRSTDPQPTHYYKEGGNYQVKLRVTTPDNCSRDTTFQLEIEKPITYNAFSPNGDNINEVFDIGLVGWGIEIYNRWGKLVYKRENYENDWRGNDVTAGTYYYTLTSPTGQTCRGWVSLLK